MEKTEKLYESKIVIVDDNKDITDTLSVLLNFEKFSNIYTFNAVKDALAFIEQNKPDVIISDLTLPETDGLEFFDKVNELYPNVIKILIGAYVTKERLKQAFEKTGIYKFIEKPWDNDELISCIKSGIKKITESNK